jgi:fluoride exporter
MHDRSNVFYHIVYAAFDAAQQKALLRRGRKPRMNHVLVIIGSALGGMARYGLSGVVARRIGETFPWGTLVVNASGCFLIGIFAATLSPSDDAMRSLLMTGVCGGYTTFSSFSLQTLTLARAGEWWRAGFNIAASVAFCLAAVGAGFGLGGSLLGGG